MCVKNEISAWRRVRHMPAPRPINQLIFQNDSWSLKAREFFKNVYFQYSLLFMLIYLFKNFIVALSNLD